MFFFLFVFNASVSLPVRCRKVNCLIAIYPWQAQEEGGERDYHLKELYLRHSLECKIGRTKKRGQKIFKTRPGTARSCNKGIISIVGKFRPGNLFHLEKKIRPSYLLAIQG